VMCVMGSATASTDTFAIRAQDRLAPSVTYRLLLGLKTLALGVLGSIRNRLTVIHSDQPLQPGSHPSLSEEDPDSRVVASRGGPSSTRGRAAGLLTVVLQRSL
jgi:hypothetical protein